MSRKEQKQKVIWVGSEKEKLAQEVFRIKKEKPGLPMLSALRQAQQVLDKTRTRNVVAITTVPWLTKRLEELSLEEVKDRSRIEEELEAKSSPLDITTIPTDQLVAEVMRRVAVSFAPMFDVFLKGVLTSHSATISATLSESVASAFNQIRLTPASPTQQESEKVRKTSVLVIGLMPDQINQLKKDGFDELFKLNFWKDQSPKVLRQLSASCDHVIGITKFISHAAEGIVTKHCKPGAYLRISGAVAELEKVLLNLSV